MGTPSRHRVLILGTISQQWVHARAWLQEAEIECLFEADPSKIMDLIQTQAVTAVLCPPLPTLLKSFRSQGFEIPFVFLMNGDELYEQREALHYGAVELMNPGVFETHFVNVLHRMCELGQAIFETMNEIKRAQRAAGLTEREYFEIRKHHGPVVLQRAILSLRKKKTA